MKMLVNRLICLVTGHRWAARKVMYVNQIKYIICLRCGKTKVV